MISVKGEITRLVGKKEDIHMSTDKRQLDKFKEAARELECDDDEAHFKDRLGKLVKPADQNSKSSN